MRTIILCILIWGGTMTFIRENIANIFYAIGSLCFLAGTLWNMLKVKP